MSNTDTSASARTRAVKGRAVAVTHGRDVATPPSQSADRSAGAYVDLAYGADCCGPATPVEPQGTPSIVAESPFNSGGNSYLFDGTPEYLSYPASDNWAFGTGDFTIEWFQYQTDSSSFPRIFSIGSYPSTSIGCSIEGGNFYAWFPDGYSPGSAEPYKNTWVHFAIVRMSGMLYVYKNGILLESTPNSNNIINSGLPLYIGIEAGGIDPPQTQFGGYLTNFRIVKGTAVYTGNFTVPTSALTNIPGTVLLIVP